MQSPQAAGKERPGAMPQGARAGATSGTDIRAAQAAGIWWEASASEPRPATEALWGAASADVAIVGAGYAGLNAAIRLAAGHGMNVAVLDAGEPGSGASGRNGGFCCPGSARRSWESLDDEFGREETSAFHRMQLEAIAHVRAMIGEHAIASAISGTGTIELAHSARAASAQRRERDDLMARFGQAAEFLAPQELAQRGYGGSGFHGGLRDPCSFGLQPADYVRGLARAAIRLGVRIHANSPVTAIATKAGAYRLATPSGEVTARKIFVATNGYTGDALLPALAGRLLPALSRIFVTRRLSEKEIAAQGWNRIDPASDSRKLLHYFRLLPDGRMMFGGRGGLNPSPAGIERSLLTLRRQFEAMFPVFAAAEATHAWAGNVCLSARLVPYAGPIGDMENAWTALAWHGNGVAMASLSGWRMADVIAGAKTVAQCFPAPMRGPLRKFPLPFLRKFWLATAYAAYGLADRWR
jgi:glycine/D-amino acid oxidase-like deaminating enzyme